MAVEVRGTTGLMGIGEGLPNRLRNTVWMRP